MFGGRKIRGSGLTDKYWGGLTLGSAGQMLQFPPKYWHYRKDFGAKLVKQWMEINESNNSINGY